MASLPDHPSSLTIGDGLSAFFGGIRFIVTTPRMWPYALVPMVIMVFLTVGLTILFLWSGNRLTGAIIGTPESTWARIGGWFVTVLVALLSIVISAVLALSLAQPLSAFALEAIAEAQEEALTGHARLKPSFWISLFNSARIVMGTLLLAGLVLATLFAISFIFPPAAIVTIPLKFLVCAWLMAWDFLDYPMGLREMGVRQRLSWVRRNFDAFSAFGIAWAALIVVPGMVLVLLPMGVAGATRLIVLDEELLE
jgi:CysZ protein